MEDTNQARKETKFDKISGDLDGLDSEIDHGIELVNSLFETFEMDIEKEDKKDSDEQSQNPDKISKIRDTIQERKEKIQGLNGLIEQLKNRI